MGSQLNVGHGTSGRQDPYQSYIWRRHHERGTDHYHLNKAWQECFSDTLFTELEPNLSALLNAHSREDFDKAVVQIKYTSRSSAAHLDHMKKFCSQHYLCAAYEIDSVPGLLGKRGSSVSESNHSMDPEEHVAALLRRQDHINTKKRSDDISIQIFCIG
jgi:hypothetical protein